MMITETCSIYKFSVINIATEMTRQRIDLIGKD